MKVEDLAKNDIGGVEERELKNRENKLRCISVACQYPEMLVEDPVRALHPINFLNLLIA